MNVIVPTTQRGSVVEFKKTTWSDIGGLDDVKQAII